MFLRRYAEIQRRIERSHRINRIPKRKLKDRDNPLEVYDADQFKQRFHMYKETVIYICDLIKLKLSSPIKRGVHIPPIIQLCVVLRYYACGSFQLCIGDLHKLSQPTISTLVKRVSTSLAKLCNKFIYMPSGDDTTRVKAAFYDIANFPDVLGCIDCSHVQILSPGGETAELFRNRKRYFSVNVQAACDFELNFQNIVARWYGSAHDTRVFENSQLYEEFEQNKHTGILLGDGGYTLSRYMMIPVENPITRAEKRYNWSQIRTRNTVERMFGVWKKRFYCLQFMRLKLKTTLIVIVATAVLHNICRRRLDIFQNDEVIPTQNVNQSAGRREPTITGNTKRNQIILNNFS